MSEKPTYELTEAQRQAYQHAFNQAYGEKMQLRSMGIDWLVDEVIRLRALNAKLRPPASPMKEEGAP